tara:strand:+ start:98 stop:352 length:255 start_codon:yes stop_codon:yes gene_type:complete
MENLEALRCGGNMLSGSEQLNVCVALPLCEEPLAKECQVVWHTELGHILLAIAKDDVCIGEGAARSLERRIECLEYRVVVQIER